MSFDFKKVKLVSFLFFFSFSVLCQGESFRAAKTHICKIPQDYTPQNLKAGIFDAVAIIPPEDNTFISGIEINIKIPESVALWRDSTACFFYDRITPFPDDNNIDYSGRKISVNPIPGKLSYTIYVPLSAKFSVKESPYAKILEAIPEDSEKVVFFRFLLAMKGAPESLEHAQFDISVKPVLTEEGYFSYTVKQPDNKNENVAVYIDDQLHTGSSSKILLKTGEHQIALSSEAYRNEVRTFIIQQAETTSLSVEMRKIDPTLKIVAPDNAKIQLDGNQLENPKDSFIISQGDHVIKFTIGDYELIKTVTAVNGRSYTVNLNVDASISEDD